VTRGACSHRAGRDPAASACAVATWLAFAVALLFSALSPESRAAESDIALERRVKAAFIYQFIPYIDWPPRAHRDGESPIVVAVAGNDQAVANLEEVIGKRTAQGRPVVIRRWRDSDAQGGAHVVYVTRGESQRLAAIARAAQAAAMLVVSEHDGALDQGSMINFRLVDGKVRFDVSLGPAERAGLRISSRLLTVAQSVRPAS
jgi:hypothetical protein